MRHFIESCPVTTGALRMGKTSTARVLVTLGRFAQTHAAGRLGTAVGAIDLAAITAATNEHLRPTAGAQKEAARGLHRRSPWNAEGRSYRQGPPAVEYCGCTCACACPLALHMSCVARPRGELGGLTGVAPVVSSAVCLSTATAAHRHPSPRFARLHSPYGLLAPAQSIINARPNLP